MKNKLIVVLGPTASGKTSTSVKIAKKLNCSILSADSRQCYKEMIIGTAAPTTEEQQGTTHYFVHSHSIHDYFNAGKFEIQALDILEKIYNKTNLALLVGGSGLYIDAVLKGISQLPGADFQLRAILETLSLRELQQKLESLDKNLLQSIDVNNPQRLIRAIEICESSNKKCSELRSIKPKKRNFDVCKIGLTMPRDELYTRINKRVDSMITAGLIKEVESLHKVKHLKPLKTVGYGELFDYFEGKFSLDKAIEEIKKNSRRYAKRQLTWWRKDNEIQWFNPADFNGIMESINQTILL